MTKKDFNIIIDNAIEYIVKERAFGACIALEYAYSEHFIKKSSTCCDIFVEKFQEMIDPVSEFPGSVYFLGDCLKFNKTYRIYMLEWFRYLCLEFSYYKGY